MDNTNIRESNRETYKQKLSLHLDPNFNHKQEILKCISLHELCIYCKANNISPQQFGPFIESYLIHKCSMTKNNASKCIGDCKDKFNEDNEIKASLGGKEHNKFNYVQLRINHKINNYIFTAYYLSPENLNQLGELFIFKIKKEDIPLLIVKYGGYAHGTELKHGKITIEDLNDVSNSKEYALRPIYDSPLWKELLKFRVNESDL